MPPPPPPPLHVVLQPYILVEMKNVWNVCFSQWQRHTWKRKSECSYQESNLRHYSTVQKECKRISPNFGYCSTEKSPKFQAKFRDLSVERSSNFRWAARKFADPRAKFRSDFVCTEAKFRIADRKFEILKRNFARLEGPRVTVFRIDNGSCLQARPHVSTRSHSTRSDLEK